LLIFHLSISFIEYARRQQTHTNYNTVKTKPKAFKKRTAINISMVVIKPNNYFFYVSSLTEYETL